LWIKVDHKWQPRQWEKLFGDMHQLRTLILRDWAVPNFFNYLVHTNDESPVFPALEEVEVRGTVRISTSTQKKLLGAVRARERLGLKRIRLVSPQPEWKAFIDSLLPTKIVTKP